MKVRRTTDVPGCWWNDILVLWEEDDAPVPDKERPNAAFERITQHKVGSWRERRDEGDVTFYLYPGGWVRIMSYQGGAVGCLVKVEEQ